MPSKVIQVQTKVGDTVKKGQVLVVLEAMKMVHTMHAPRDGKVIKVSNKAGDLVDTDAVLAVLE